MEDTAEEMIDGLTGRLVVLAGPGVVDEGAIEELRAFASAGTLGVANTWGAKGVFAWDSPHHLGTCGLQARDFELLGFADADAIVATGVDSREASPDRFALARVIDVSPRALGDLTGRVHATGMLRNDLYPRVAAVAQPGYVDTKVPLHPARAVADLGAVLPPGGLVVAEPGLAGLWVARTFPTPALAPGQPRRVLVPARRDPGAAIAAARAAARGRRPVIYVTAGEPDAATRAAIDVATAAGDDLAVVVWHAAGTLHDADEHSAGLRDALASPGCTRVDVPVELGDTQMLLEAAGPVVAWGGLTESELRYE